MVLTTFLLFPPPHPITPCPAAVSLRDVSARVEMEAALRAADVAEASARGKAAFLSTISHELRNPLNAVLGMTQVGGRVGGGVFVRP